MGDWLSFVQWRGPQADNPTCFEHSHGRAGKKKYPSEEIALEVLRVRMKSNENRPPVPLHVYKCPYCCQWHLTKKVQEAGRD